MFHALQKVNMRTCYAKHKINLACPKNKLYQPVTFRSMITYNMLTQEIIFLLMA